MTPRAIFLNGAVGVGKTTTMEAVGEALRQRQVTHGLIDLDALRQFWPAPVDDRFNLRLELANLTAVASTYYQHGARVLVMAGVLELHSGRGAYERAVGCALHVVRLTAPRELVRSRLQARHEGDPEGLAWHLARFDELSTLLHTAGTEDTMIDVGQDGPRLVANRVLDLVDL